MSEVIASASSETSGSTTAAKALKVNLDVQRYGAFAEIGAGQEVARHFFQVGKASQTIAKSMSAYDMTYSDEIYGREKSGRYVCESRLVKMLEKEYSLLLRRLNEKRGDRTAFFAFANTVATGAADDPRCHGWIGIRFQDKPGQEFNDITFHVRMLDPRRLQQQEALGILGVNLIETAFYGTDDQDKFVARLVQNLRDGQINIDALRCSGPKLKNFNNRMLNLELVRAGLAEAALFGADGETLHIRDALFGKSVIVERGNFSPINHTHVDVMEKGIAQFAAKGAKKSDILPILEIVVPQNAKPKDLASFSERIDLANAAGYPVLISRFKLFYQLKQFIRKHTAEPMALVMSAAKLDKLFDETYYKDLEGQWLEGMSKLLDDKNKLYIYPHKTEKLCLTAAVFQPKKSLAPIYAYFRAQEQIIDISDCDEIDTSVSSETILKRVKNRDKGWEKDLPEAVAQMIKARKMYQ